VGIKILVDGVLKTLFEQKQAKLQKKRHFMKNKMEFMQHFLKCSKFSCCLILKN
jgi:hypothetical protein